MRLLKAITAMIAGGVLWLGVGLSTYALQAPPAKKPATEPAKAPVKQAPAAQKQAPPAKKSASGPTKQAAPAKTAPPKKSPAASTTAPPAQEPTAAAGQAAESPLMSPGNRRDPFSALVSSKRGTGQQTPEMTCRAPGKGSVVIDTMRVDGLVRSAEGMIAAVRTPQGRVYFLREGDRLCDGRVERITMEGITLRQSSRDAFGKAVERPVSKRLFPSAGE